MKALLLALALATCAIVVAPTASACPDPDNPCTPPTYDPIPQCPNGMSLYGCVKYTLSELPP